MRARFVFVGLGLAALVASSSADKENEVEAERVWTDASVKVELASWDFFRGGHKYTKTRAQMTPAELAEMHKLTASRGSDQRPGRVGCSAAGRAW